MLLILTQGQNEQKEKEKAELATELDQTKQQIENVRSSLQQQLKENDSLKVCPRLTFYI